MNQIIVYSDKDGNFFFARSGEAVPTTYTYFCTAGNIADATYIAGAMILAENGRHYGSDDSVEFAYNKIVNIKDFQLEIAAFQVGEELKKMLVVN